MTPLSPDAQRRFALEVVQNLRQAGHESYWAGGCVRDQLLGRTPVDFDVATAAKPDEVRQVFGRRRTLAIGAAFGVITVLGPREAGPVEVATFRQDAAYTDGRHPDHVTFSSAREDAQRRDFTINGLFFDPVSGEVIDFVEGQADLKAGVIRAIGRPESRFEEDRLRMLRAVRFAATFDFELEEETRRAVGRMASAVTSVSAERIAGEMERMLALPHRTKAVRLLLGTGLAAAVLPEMVAPDAPNRARRESCLDVLDRLAEPTFALALAVLVSPSAPSAIPSGAMGGLSALAEEPQGVSAIPSGAMGGLSALAEEPQDASAIPSGAMGVCARWRLPNKVADRAVWLIDHRHAIHDARTTRWSKLQPLLISPGVEELLQWIEAEAAVAGRSSPEVDHCRTLLAQPRERLDPPPLISGDDLLRRGLIPGPVFRHLLDAVRAAQLDGRIKTAEEAMRLVGEMGTGDEG